ncbi:hypothetical protein [Brevundimonas sp.]|uniref:hypothetical protein n=1 Tax=Brevundimonas sp. TaxID=1871086 RepID=UPI002737C88C|nr:hypothetical protein [Brevundimonas sp.]MDP3802215.1 hypothetical protein [Brevundimonas sp.]
MAVLILLLLLALGVLAMVGLRRDLGELGRVRIGAVDEDLSRARTLMRRLLVAAPVLLAILIGLVIAGERWAEDWRRSLVATWVLNGLIVALTWGCLRGASRAVRNQWSPTGSYAAMFMGMAEQAIFMILLVPAVYWRLGVS